MAEARGSREMGGLDSWGDVTAAYCDAFGTDFPFASFEGTYTDMFRLMKECLRRGEPYVPADFGDDGCDEA